MYIVEGERYAGDVAVSLFYYLGRRDDQRGIMIMAYTSVVCSRPTSEGADLEARALNHLVAEVGSTLVAHSEGCPAGTYAIEHLIGGVSIRAPHDIGVGYIDHGLLDGVEGHLEAYRVMVDRWRGPNPPTRRYGRGFVVEPPRGGFDHPELVFYRHGADPIAFYVPGTATEASCWHQVAEIRRAIRRYGLRVDSGNGGRYSVGLKTPAGGLLLGNAEFFRFSEALAFALDLAEDARRDLVAIRARVPEIRDSGGENKRP
jgi:hypothetical protein